MLLYISEGLLGVPVFAGGSAGLLRLLGPTGGYLAGMMLAAYVTGSLAERGWDRRPLTAALAMLCGNLAIYLLGLPWLAHFVGAGHVLAAGLLPFIPGDLLKLAIAAMLLPTGWAILGAARRPPVGLTLRPCRAARTAPGRRASLLPGAARVAGRAWPRNMISL